MTQISFQGPHFENHGLARQYKDGSLSCAIRDNWSDVFTSSSLSSPASSLFLFLLLLCLTDFYLEKVIHGQIYGISSTEPYCPVKLVLYFGN